MKGKIIVAIDGSKNALDALEEAVRLSIAFPSKLYLINVQPSFKTLHTRLFLSDKDIREYQIELYQTAMKTAIQYLDDQKVEYEAILKIGDPTHRICQLAKEINAKYIVMGSRGLGLFRGTVLGSVSTGVLHDTTIPVVIIPNNES